MAGRRVQRAVILIFGGDAAFRESMRSVCVKLRCEPMFATSPEESAGQLHPALPLLILFRSTGTESAEIVAIAEVRRRYVGAPLIVLPEHSSEEAAVAALRAGADDYSPSPQEWDEVAGAMARLLDEIAPLPETSEQEEVELVDGWQMVGTSPEVRNVKAYVKKVASSDSNVLITGETGTGKE
jgi:DNA-binding NtrC family response regulator